MVASRRQTLLLEPERSGRTVEHIYFEACQNSSRILPSLFLKLPANHKVFGFHSQKRREIRAQFNGGAITSDGGGLLLREVDKRVGILRFCVSLLPASRIIGMRISSNIG
jgi:hypothetical protein